MSRVLSVGSFAVVLDGGRPVRVVRVHRPGPGRISRWQCDDGSWYFGRELRVVDEDEYLEADLDYQLAQAIALDEREFLR
jgi:hypothetical protein